MSSLSAGRPAHLLKDIITMHRPGSDIMNLGLAGSRIAVCRMADAQLDSLLWWRGNWWRLTPPAVPIASVRTLDS